MSLQSRYVLRELFVPFLIGTAAVVLMFQANLLMALFKTISAQHVPLLAVLQLIIYKTPFFMQLTLPVGVSLASSLAYSRLTRETELTAMRIAGSPILRTILPVAFFGLLVAAGDFYMTERVMPFSEKKFREKSIEVSIQGAIPDFASNAVIRLKDYVALIGSVSRGDHGELQLNDVLLFDKHQVGQVTAVLSTKGAYKDGIFRLTAPSAFVFSGTDVSSFKSGDEMVINERIDPQALFLQAEANEQTIPELKNAIKAAKTLGQSTTSLEIAYHSKFAVPAACLIFAFVAPVFAIIFARSGGFVGVLLSIFLVFLYYNGFVISTEILGRNGTFPPVVAAWLPNILFMIAGVFAFRRLE